MRVAPTSVEFSNLALFDGINNPVVSAAVLDANTSESVILFVTSSSLTAFRPYFFRSQSSLPSFLAVSAEL
jgi:hypothetical protein